MPWAKLDDRFHENKKVRRAWRRCPEALGLHVLAITYCAGNLTDGIVDREFVEDRVPNTRARDRMIATLTGEELWHEHPDGWEIHDYNEFNPTRASIEARRQARSEAARAAAVARWAADAKTHSTTHAKSHAERMPERMRIA